MDISGLCCLWVDIHEIPFANRNLTFFLTMMKFSQAISWVKWLSGEKTIVSKTISDLVLRVLV